MENKKGLSQLAIILIALAIIIIGGGAYFLIKTPQAKAPAAAPADQTAPISIFVDAPTAGQVVTVGQTLTIKWSVPNLPAGAGLDISAVPYCSATAVSCAASVYIASVPNTGSYEWTVAHVPPGQYAIEIAYPHAAASGAMGGNAQATSALFTIQAATGQ